jgi:hypothetical protein
MKKKRRMNEKSVFYAKQMSEMDNEGKHPTTNPHITLYRQQQRHHRPTTQPEVITYSDTEKMYKLFVYILTNRIQWNYYLIFIFNQFIDNPTIYFHS